ncbi:MAG: DUF2807 domain-containing protein [Rikenellaceae bacterium]|nr:DUF2807 domain-containing protein [Rikenellaceae bacterium]
MKHLLFAALLLICINAAAFRPEANKEDENKARQTAKTATSVVETKFQNQPIDRVEVGFAFNTVIKQSDKTGVQISIDSRLQPYLVCKLENGKLILSMKNDRPQYLNYGQYWVGKPTAVVSVKQLDGIQAQGAAKVTVEGAFTADKFTVKTSGAGAVNDLNVKTEGPVTIGCSGAGRVGNASFGKPSKVTVDASGASKIDFTCHAGTLNIDASGAVKVSAGGSASHLTAEASGAANCQLGELKAHTASCSTSGAARIDCYATGELSASASGASRITCAGDPEVLKKEASKASSVSIR